MMIKLKATVLIGILTVGIQLAATPIVVVSTKDGFVIGTNGHDSGGIEVCKIHYAGSTVVLRAADVTRWPKTTNPNEIRYDSTLHEWGVLDPHKNMSSIVVTTRQFFTDSTEHMADLSVHRPGSHETKDQFLEGKRQQVVVAGFTNGVPTLYAYNILFFNGAFHFAEGHPLGPFQNTELWWRGEDIPPSLPHLDGDAEAARDVVRKRLQYIYNIEPNKTAFGEPWEIVHLTKDGVVWLEGHKELCERDRLKFAPK